MAHPPTIVVVDDAPDVRLLLKTQLRISGRLTVVGEGADGFDAVELAREHEPELMLLDVSMPRRDGLAALPLVLEASPQTRVVMFSGFQEAGLIEHTRELGATAFVQKSLPLQDLVARLVAIAEGAGDDETRDGSPPAPGAPSPPLDSVPSDHLDRFREIFDDAAIGMATVTLDGRIVRMNRHLRDLLGDEDGRLIGASYVDLTKDGEVADALAELDGGTTTVQVEHGLGGEDDRRFQMTASAVLDAQDRPLYVFLQVQDVTRQRQAEETLRRVEQRFRLLVEAVQDYAIFMLDPDGRIASWNLGAERIKGYAADEIIGQHFRAFYPQEQQVAHHPEHELELARRDGRYEEEGWRIRKDGSRFWAQVTITAIRDDEGTLVGFAKVTRDSTERRRMMSLLESANDQLKRSADDLAEFLAITAHELRTPVGVIASTAVMMARHHDELEAEERSDLAEVLRRNSGQLRRLLDDLLTASRAQARTLELRPVALVVDEQLVSLVAAVQTTSPEAEIRTEVPSGLVVRADVGRFGQMVDNLLNNAVRHGEPPITVAAGAEDDQVVVRVTDSGPGVPSEVLPRLFDRFGTSTGGTGLGLYIVRELARAHGGDAAYDLSTKTFEIRLPRSEVDP